MTQKILIYFFLFFSNLTFAQESDTLHFKWLGDSINGEYYPKSAMIIPLRIENDTATYYFQFDTGANVSSIYTGKEHKPDLVSPTHFSNITKTNIGSIRFDTISYMPPFYEQEKLVIGTIGADVFENKVVQIDYPGQEITFRKEIDTNTFDSYAMKLSFGRPVLDLNIDNTTYGFMFDTGSSLFELWTSKRMWKKMAFRKSLPNEFSIWSWGQLSTVYSAPLLYHFSFFKCEKNQLSTVSYSTNKKHDKIFKQAKIHGVIGNKPFFNSVVILDFRTKQIGVKKCN